MVYPAQAAVEVGPVGTLLTRPFGVPAERLTINAEAAGKAGRLRVPGEDGTVGESAPVACDDPAVEAGLQEPLRMLRGKPVLAGGPGAAGGLLRPGVPRVGLATAVVDRYPGRTPPPEAGDNHPSAATGDASANEGSPR